MKKATNLFVVIIFFLVIFFVFYAIPMLIGEKLNQILSNPFIIFGIIILVIVVISIQSKK